MPSTMLPDLETISLRLGAEESNFRSSTLIFFITGNPGLIGYYTTYLNTLQSLLHPVAHHNSSHVHIYGQSLAGFADDVTSRKGEPYTLEHQILLLEESLRKQCIKSGNKAGQSYDNIILIGHSVGSYILLELIQRTRLHSSSLYVMGGILLFPTITHIAQSPSGIIISKLFRWREAPNRLGIIIQRVLSLCSASLVTRLVGIVTRMPSEFAEVTAEFLQSQMGIWQALSMAREEMETITEDRWDEEIWGAEGVTNDQKPQSPKLVFYFGCDDHWVANHTRDALIAARGRSSEDTSNSKPIMLIDNDNIPHGFCLKHGEIMAEKTKVWIEEFRWT